MKLSKYGRASGGVARYVTNTLKAQVKFFFFTVCMSILKQIFYLVLMCIYYQPEGLPVSKEQGGGIEILFKEILKFQCLYPSHKVSIVEDLNARIEQNQKM